MTSNMAPQAITKPVGIALPQEDQAFVRLPTVLGVYPVSKAEWWKGVREKRYPAPVQLAKRISAWRVGDIRKLLASAKERS
jgi:prophage regulatory protein